MCIIALEALLTDTLICGHLYTYGHLHKAPFQLLYKLYFSVATDTFFAPRELPLYLFLLFSLKPQSILGGALLPVIENSRPAFSPDPTDCPWVSEDGLRGVTAYSVIQYWFAKLGLK